jgi:hypothetical protein
MSHLARSPMHRMGIDSKASAAGCRLHYTSDNIIWTEATP